MHVRTFISGIVISATVISIVSCSGNASRAESDSLPGERSEKQGGIRLGAPGGGPVIDKSGDAVLQSMIKEVVPRFRQLEYTDSKTGKKMTYNLLSPIGAKAGQTYPLVLFMADASTPGTDASRPLTQGYGALVWGTDSWQASHPCFVLVPQFSGIGVNDDYEHTEEVDIVARMVGEVATVNPVDRSRMYTTGQSMGGMISMYFNITYPDLFAASLFVDCHWDTSRFDDLATHTFTYVTAGKTGKSFGNIQALEEAVEKAGRKYAFAEWSAKLPASEQDSLATALLSKGAPVNIINFSPKSVLPADGKGSEHMYSFDYAYKLTPVREWLFLQHK